MAEDRRSIDGLDADAEQSNDVAPLLSQPDSRPATSSAYEDEPELGVAKLFALTCINGGLQVFFSTIMANLPPNLQALQLSKSATAAIIICLPLSGAFIGPIAGAFSDRLRTRFGRRRPMIVAGAICTVAFLLLLSWTQQLVWAIAGCQANTFECGAAAETSIIVIAVLCTICMSVAVQPVQAGVRSLMVDIAPAKQQSKASSYAGRIQGLSAIFSFFASSMYLPSIPGLGHLTQFQVLALLNLITLGGSVVITCVFIREVDSRREDMGSESGRQRAVAVLRHIFKTVTELKGRIRQTCETQFCSWFAWFPLLYYTTTYVAELGTADMSTPPQEKEIHDAQAGSLASLSFAIIGFFFIVTLPVALPYASKLFNKRRPASDDRSESGLQGLIWLWILTQPFLGIILVAALLSAYQWQGIVLIALAGLPWAVTQWVPFAIVGFETSRLGLTATSTKPSSSSTAESQSGAILGVHNMAISLPQVLSGLMSSLTYKIAEGAGSQVPTAWVLATSGIAALLAGALARRTL